jgi:tetratricopeptide (TPR) repeat protein/tRNA A-37 threonylcarbamoyl transferase component Bud32
LGPCPSIDDLQRFLSDGASVGVDLHLRSCGRCREAAERLTDDGSLRGLPASPHKGTLSWRGEPELTRLMDALCDLGHPHAGGPDARTSWAPSAAMPLDPPEDPGDLGTLGPYAVEAEVGRGGMGVVFRARDRRMGRTVALKVLHPSLAGDRDRRRFFQEVRASARVEHDHVVRVYDTSDPADRLPYLAMEYLAGPSLAEEIRSRQRLEPREAAEVVAQAADGLAAAHAADLIHRDVKPANVLLDPATGRAKVGDFGLARLASSDSDLTRDGVVAGTPAYLSPEQARGEAEVDRRSDVYALGVTLYECLAGEPPFRGTPHRILQQVLHDEPRPPRSLNDAVPRDLETICLKAMAKDPARRYATAAELSADLRRFLRGEPIVARPAGRVERAWRWCRNNRRVALLGTAVGLLLAALASGAALSAVWIARERTEALKQARRAEDERGLALDAFTALVGGIQDRLGTQPGTLELRRSLLETARDGLRRVAQGGPVGDSQADLWTVVAWKKLGDLDLSLGRTKEAEEEFARAASLAGRLAAADPGSVPVRRELASAYDRLGDQVARRYEMHDSSDEPYRKAFEIRRKLVEDHPGDFRLRRDLRISQGKLAEVLMARGDIAGARAIHRDMLDRMASETVPRAEWAQFQSDLRFVHGRLGLLAQREFDGHASLEAFRRSLVIAEDLLASDPENLVWRREHAVSLEMLGAACLDFLDWPAAETHFRDLLAVRQAEADSDPSDLAARRALALAHQRLGDLAYRRRDHEAARSAYLEALKILDDLAARDPGSVMAQKDRLIACRRLGTSAYEAGLYEEVASWAEREMEILGDKALPPFENRDGWLGEARTIRDLSRLLPRAIDDPAFARQQPSALVPTLLMARAVVLARRGRHEEAARAADELLTLPDNPQVPLSAARAYALSTRSLPADAADLRATYTGSLLKALRLALRADPALARRLLYDPDFDAVRDDPGFRSLMEPFSRSEGPKRPSPGR